MSAGSQHATHGNREKRRGEREADPETPSHVAQFRILLVGGVTVRGSSAMPQMGQVPGSERTISGCMGQVYSVREAARGRSGSSAIPHEGQGTGLVSRTSGHMGHT